MSRKNKSKGHQPWYYPNYTWLPAFFVGLCIGLLIHFIPGMDLVLAEARKSTYSQEQHAQEQPILWRPQINRH